MASELTHKEISDLVLLGMLWRGQAAEKLILNSGSSILHTLHLAKIITEARRRHLATKDWQFLGDFANQAEVAKVGQHAKAAVRERQKESDKPVLIVAPPNAPLNHANLFGSGPHGYKLVLTSEGINLALSLVGKYKGVITGSAYMTAWNIHLSRLRGQYGQQQREATGPLPRLRSTPPPPNPNEWDW